MFSHQSHHCYPLDNLLVLSRLLVRCLVANQGPRLVWEIDPALVKGVAAYADPPDCGAPSKPQGMEPSDLLLSVYLDHPDQTPFPAIVHGTTVKYHVEDTRLNLYVISKMKLGSRQMLTPILDVIPQGADSLLVGVPSIIRNSLARVIVIHERFAVNHMGAILLFPDGVYIPCPYERRDMEPKDGHVHG